MPQPVPDLSAIRAAAERIAGLAHNTPVFTSRTLDGMAGCSLLLKAESLQRAGAFKFRGAMNAVSALPPALAERGVATHSSGNHAAALALAARIRGIPAHIVMPENAPPNKRAAVLGYGARVVPCASTLAAREETAARVVAETGATLIHPYEHPDVIAGQGTVALEILAAHPDIDAIVAPVGGGGLVSGIALAFAEAAPRVRVFAAEPAGADDAWRSRQAGRRLPQTDPRTVADGLRTSLGENTWPVIRDRVEDVLRVEEADIVSAMRLLFERVKLVVEPSGAVPLAAALSGALSARLGLSRVALVLSGGNADLDHLPWLS